jgi:hypothetical protein
MHAAQYNCNHQLQKSTAKVHEQSAASNAAEACFQQTLSAQYAMKHCLLRMVPGSAVAEHLPPGLGTTPTSRHTRSLALNQCLVPS